jgi:RHS repeat-associated protein
LHVRYSSITRCSACCDWCDADHLNTPRLIADSTGTTVWRWDQAEPFGNTVPDENPSGLGAFEFPLRDEGTYADKETGLVYNINRYRDTGIGRFPQAQPSASSDHSFTAGI